MKRVFQIAVLAAICCSASSEAAKVLLHKSVSFTEDGKFAGHREFNASLLDSLSFVQFADYPTFVAGEVSDEGLSSFEVKAREFR